MREKAFSLSLSVLATLACAFLCASTTHADQASAAAPAPAVGNANPAPAPAIAPAPEPRLPASGLTVVGTLPCQPCGPCGCRHFANNEAYRFDPTGNNPNIPRGLVGSGYYGAYSPDSYPIRPASLTLARPTATTPPPIAGGVGSEEQLQDGGPERSDANDVLQAKCGTSNGRRSASDGDRQAIRLAVRDSRDQNARSDGRLQSLCPLYYSRFNSFYGEKIFPIEDSSSSRHVDTRKEWEPRISGRRPRTNAAPMTRMKRRDRFQGRRIIPPFRQGGGLKAAGRTPSRGADSKQSSSVFFISGISVIRGRSPHFCWLRLSEAGPALGFLWFKNGNHKVTTDTKRRNEPNLRPAGRRLVAERF